MIGGSIEGFAGNSSPITVYQTQMASGLPAAIDWEGQPHSTATPQQVEAIGLHTAKGESTFISTSAVTSACSAETSVSIWMMRLTRRKSPQASTFPLSTSSTIT